MIRVSKEKFMKKLIFLLVCVAIITPVFAQNDSRYNESNIYYVNVSVEKVYPSGSGYIVQYRKGINNIGTVGLPNEWFSVASGKAEIVVLPRGKNWPTLTVFYRDGEFSHVRLYVHRSKGHQTWGNVPQTADVSVFFTNKESLDIEFQ
jgi:hypothetical protein